LSIIEIYVSDSLRSVSMMMIDTSACRINTTISNQPEYPSKTLIVLVSGNLTQNVDNNVKSSVCDFVFALRTSQALSLSCLVFGRLYVLTLREENNKCTQLAHMRALWCVADCSFVSLEWYGHDYYFNTYPVTLDLELPNFVVVFLQIGLVTTVKHTPRTVMIRALGIASSHLGAVVCIYTMQNKMCYN